MGLVFDYVGPAVAIAGLPDASPNAGAPANNRVFLVSRKTEDDQNTLGVKFFLVVDDDSDPTTVFDVTVWARDAGTGRWAALATSSAVKPNEMLIETDSGPADVFFQLTNPVAGAATTVKVVAEPA